MIRFIGILALIALSFPGLLNVSLFVDYQVDMDTYIERCENRDVPMMHCDGKCLLAKKIAQANEDDRPDAPQFVSEVLNYIGEAPVELAFNLIEIELGWEHSVKDPVGHPTSTFHPPSDLT